MWCLAAGTSYVFDALHDSPTWLDARVPPERTVRKGGAHVLGRDIVHALAPACVAVVDALLAAGVDAAAHDVNGFTPLHYATLGGMDEV